MNTIDNAIIKSRNAAHSGPRRELVQREAWRVNEFCEAVRISRSHFYELIKQGKIRTVMLGGRRLIPDSERARLLGEAA